MTMDTLSQNKPTGTQLDLSDKAVPAQLQRGRKQANPLRLVQRDLDLLTAIHDFGGVLTTIQIACLFWGPDLGRRLRGLGIAEPTIQRWLQRYPAGALYEQIELYKWLQALNRLRQFQRLSNAQQKQITWLEGLRPNARAELVTWLDQQLSRNPDTWLTIAIEQKRRLPEAFRQRPQFPSDFVSSACKTRLRYLAQTGLLQPHEQAIRLSEGRAQTCYFLTRKGFNLVAQAKGVDPKTLDFKAAGAYGSLHLSHRLAINHFRIAMQLHVAHKGYRIVEWEDDNALRRRLQKEKVTLLRLVRDPKTGDQEEKAEEHRLKIPDSYFVLDMGEAGVRHCFLELDNQTLTLDYTNANAKDYASKIRILAAFYKGRYKELFPAAGDSMWFLTVTTGTETRLQHLKATAEGVFGRQNRAADRYWFTTMDQIPLWEEYFGTALFAPIWLRGGDNRYWALDEVEQGRATG